MHIYKYYNTITIQRIECGVRMKNWIFEQYVIVSGASSGIGKQLCRLFIEKYGAKVIGIGRNEEKMRALKKELGDNQEKFSYHLFDVSDKNGWLTLKEHLTENGIRPVLLVNNAGMFIPFNKITQTPTEEIDKVLSVNFRSVTYAVENISPILQGNGKHLPSVVNVASSAALCTVVGTGAYSASKAALKAYTEALALEEKGRKYIGLICPGTTATDLFRADENTKNSALDILAMPASKMAKKIAKKILKKRRRAVLGWDAKLMNLTAKIMPVKGLFLIRWVMKASKSKVFSNVFDEE